jgi:hypothetical protein
MKSKMLAMIDEQYKSSYIKQLEEELMERDKYKIGHDRYEKLRRLNLREMKELYLKHLRSLEHFDTLVDQLK